MRWPCLTPVLMYHAVSSDPRYAPYRPFVVGVDAFRRQLDEILKSGRRPLTLAKAYSLSLTDASEQRSAVLTFDDCPKELLDTAIPIMERVGIRATFFAVAGMLGGRNSWDDRLGLAPMDLVDRHDLEQIAALGHEVGSHGLTHTSLRHCSRREMTRELRDSKSRLEDVVQKPVTSFCYPFGDWAEDAPRVLQDAGYHVACAIFSNAMGAFGDPYRIRRAIALDKDVGMRLRIKLGWLYQASRFWRDRGL